MNPSYSLRAFARDLNISASALSNYINGRHQLSKKRMIEISQRIGMSEERIKAIEKSCDASEPPIEFPIDSFSIIADWQNLALLECINLPSVTSWQHCEQVLGVDQYLLKQYSQRLVEVGLLKKKGKAFKDLYTVDDKSIFEFGVPNAAVRSAHKQILQKAVQAVDNQSSTERINNSLTIAFAEDQIQEAINMIKKFRMSFHKKFGKPSLNKSKVYLFSLAFFDANTDRGR